MLLLGLVSWALAASSLLQAAGRCTVAAGTPTQRLPILLIKVTDLGPEDFYGNVVLVESSDWEVLVMDDACPALDDAHRLKDFQSFSQTWFPGRLFCGGSVVENHLDIEV